MHRLKSLYLNPKFSGAYSGFESFYRNRKLTEPRSEVKKVLYQLPPYYLHKFGRKKFPKRRTIVHFLGHQICFDLLVGKQYEIKVSKNNNNTMCYHTGFAKIR